MKDTGACPGARIGRRSDSRRLDYSVPARAIARASTPSSIDGVSRRVNVFCWLGWKQPTQPVHRPGGPRRRARSAAAAGPGPRAPPAARSTPSQAKAPSATMTRTRSSNSISRSRYGRQLSRSSGVGLFAGGQQRLTAVTYAPCSDSPSSRCDGCPADSRSRPGTAPPNRKSPDRSPVKIRPVRLPPWAAGARPTSRIRAPASPNPGSGRAQYRWPANRSGGFRAAASRHATSRGQRRQADDLGGQVRGARTPRPPRHFRAADRPAARRSPVRPGPSPRGRPRRRDCPARTGRASPRAPARPRARAASAGRRAASGGG